MVETITIFVLAIFVGYYVVWGNTSTTYAIDGGDQCLVFDHYRGRNDSNCWPANGGR